MGPGGACSSEANDGQTRDSNRVANVASPDDGLFSTDAGYDLRRGFSDRMNWNGGLQLIEEGAAAIRTLEFRTNPRRAGSMAAVEP